MYLRKKIGFVGLAVTLALVATTVSADPKPKNAKATDSQVVANMYAGTSRAWKSCKGGIYFGGGWEAQAYCNRNSESVGLGKWSVKKGVLCSQVTWYWKDGDGVGSKPGDRPDCIAHITDADGQIWRRWNDDADWWRVPKSIKDDKSGFKGNKFKSKINKNRKKLGV